MNFKYLINILARMSCYGY